jgi:2-keto-4-pentenoate hydratase
MSQDPLSEYTAALVAAHRGDRAAARPQSLPATLADAMRIQRDVTRALGFEVAGWKVGFTPDGTPVAGPMYASVLQPSPASRPLPAGGFLVEIELAFRLANDLPARSHSREDILAAASEALIGIELIHGRLGELPALPYFAFVADNIGNDGYVAGAGTPSFRSLDLKALRLRFEIDGEVVQERVGGHPQGDPVEPLRAYAETPIDGLGGLRKGQIVTTGSLTKPLRVDRPARLRASLEGIGEVTLTLES